MGLRFFDHAVVLAVDRQLCGVAFRHAAYEGSGRGSDWRMGLVVGLCGPARNHDQGGGIERCGTEVEK
jgi:hypothetical protein